MASSRRMRVDSSAAASASSCRPWPASRYARLFSDLAGSRRNAPGAAASSLSSSAALATPISGTGDRMLGTRSSRMIRRELPGGYICAVASMPSSGGRTGARRPLLHLACVLTRREGRAAQKRAELAVSFDQRALTTPWADLSRGVIGACDGHVGVFEEFGYERGHPSRVGDKQDRPACPGQGHVEKTALLGVREGVRGPVLLRRAAAADARQVADRASPVAVLPRGGPDQLHPRLRPAHHLRHPDHRLHRPRRPVRAGRDPRQHHRTAAAGARDRHARADLDLHRPGRSRRQAALPADRQAHRAAALARPPRRALPALAQTPGPGSQVSRRRGRLCGAAAASPATWWTSPRPPRARASVTAIAWRLGMGRSALPPGTRRWARRPRAGPGSSSAPATQVFAGAPAPSLSRRRSCRVPAPNSP
jgi:hypothetical protein